MGDAEETIEQARARYVAAMASVEMGISMMMGIKPEETSPKSLRAGANSAMVQISALTRLLMSKGIITEEELFIFLADAAEEEARLYQRMLLEVLGINVTLKQ